MNKFLLFSFLFLSLLVNAQDISQTKVFSCQQILKSNDSKFPLFAGKAYKIDLICSPVGSGAEKEVEASGKSEYYFEKERNIAWIKFTAVKTGKLAIRIAPKSPKDDYDFLLFKDEGASTKEQIVAKIIKPVRSNLARTMNVNDGVTGLNYNAGNNYIGQGPNPAFSAFIEVKENENYFLVLDNVYDGGEGAVITLDYLEIKSINGVIGDENNKPIKADVVWEDKVTGVEIAKTVSDEKTGEFKIDVPYNSNPTTQYVLSATSDKHFFTEITYTSSEIESCKPAPISLVLPLLAKGKRTKLGNINFVGGQHVFLPGAFPTLKRLARLMVKNPNMKILIEGHTNGCDEGTQSLSENRAIAVKNYLTKNQVSDSRLNTIGLNCKFMLYPITSSEAFQSLNRRVEIVVEYY